MEQIIYLEPDEDVLSIRDRIETAEAKRVLLVVPPYSDVLTRRVDLQVIQRRSAQAGIEVALVTDDGEIRSQAREVGLPVFDSIDVRPKGTALAQTARRRSARAPPAP